MAEIQMHFSFSCLLPNGKFSSSLNHQISTKNLISNLNSSLKLWQTMGNCFSIQISGGDSLINRCWDCTAGQAEYIWKLDENLERLQEERDGLRAMKNDLMRRIRNEEGPQMKGLERVQLWLSRVDWMLTEVEQLIINVEQETKNLCLGGCCSKNCTSSYRIGKTVYKKLNDVIVLRQNGAFEPVVEKITTENDYVRKLSNDLRALQVAVDELRGLHDDVMGRVAIEDGPQLKQIEVWCSRVNSLTIEADELITEGTQEVEKWRQGDFSNSTLGERVSKSLEDVISHKQKGAFKNVVAKVPSRQITERPSVQTVGMENMIDKVWNCLIKEQVGLLGIYGMGGVGKTTLLNLTNNKFLTASHDFELVIWVVVSKDVRLDNVQEEIARKIGLSNDVLWQKKCFAEKSEAIYSKLRKVKFVLLLDDIWKRIELTEMGIPISKGQNGSKIVFTSRSEEVCAEMEVERTMKVKPLIWDKAWQLFKGKVGERVLAADPDIPRIAQAVARECSGLPLALTTIGRAMASKRTLQEWKNARDILRKSTSKFRGMGDGVFPILRFSFDNLPDYKIRACFLYCSLFPEDSKIEKDALIEYWIYENFWDDDNGLDPVNEGYDIIGTLVRACLLEEEGNRIKMHDVIRDLAIWIASDVEKEKEKYYVQAGSSLSTENLEMRKWQGGRRISLMANYISELREVPKCPELVTLFLSYNPDFRIPKDGFFQYMVSLTVLDLSKTAVRDLPHGLGACVSLAYLNLSNTSLRKWSDVELKNLKYLNLEHARSLKGLPKYIVNTMPSLQVLKMAGGVSLITEKEEGSSDLSKIDIVELEGFVQLRALTITIRCENVLLHIFNSNKLLNSIQVLWIKHFLSESFDFLLSSSSVSSTLARHESPETSHQSKLKRLHCSPMLRNRCFNSLNRVEFYDCWMLMDLTWLIILAPNLAHLRVLNCNNLLEIISFAKLVGDESLNAFARLKFLDLRYLPKLKSVYWKPLPFLFLEEIKVFDCPFLKMLPLNSNSAKGNQLIIVCQEVWWRNLQWDDGSTETAFHLHFESPVVISRALYKGKTNTSCLSVQVTKCQEANCGRH